jgi:hypothetical protein
MSKILHLTLQHQWFEEIAIGKKHEEYRIKNAYWKKRIEGRNYDEIHFRNGYQKDAPFMRVEYKGWQDSTWQGVPFYALQLGCILEVRNYVIP